MKTMKDYHDLFLKWDVLLLVDVFEKFRNDSFKNYGLCLSHYLRAPGLSWDAMPKMTKIKPELITDANINIFFEKVQEVEYLIFPIDIANTAQKMRFSIKHFSSKCCQICKKQICGFGHIY